MIIMKNLILKITDLKKSKTNSLILTRANEFLNFKRNNKDLFSELCFCTLTANYNAEKAILIQKKVGNGFITLSEDKLKEKLKGLGYRYPNKRAEYILANRQHYSHLSKILKEHSGEHLREWIVKNIKGLGFKEASHFLRNIGYGEYAIIDFHIVDLLEKEKLITRPKNLNPENYIKIEKILLKLAKKVNLNLAELDLYLWYLETGKVLK